MPVVLPVPQVAKLASLPSPIGGINALDPLVSMQPTDSIFQYNLIPSQYGCKVRTGYSLWASGISSTRTIIPYNGSVPAQDKLFAAGPNGIYDISSAVTNPAPAISFISVTSASGLGNSINVATLGGHYICYADEVNGYYTYTEGGGWAKVAMGAGGTQVSGFDPSTFVHVCQFKERLWFTLRDSSTAVYLPTGAIFGAATQFNFGNKFRHGGFLVGIYTWTLDGGSGIDDYLVAISSGGDVVIYQGTDPSVATSFSVVGQWYIGPPPAGRRIAGSFGGDLYVLSSYGVLPLSKLIAGVPIQDDSVYLSRKISPLINSVMGSVRTNSGWEVRLIPSENLLLIASPQVGSNPYQQFVQSLNTQGWAIYRDIPYFTGDAWNGQFYIGTSDGRVLWHTGNLDISSNINWSYLSAYQDIDPGRFNRMGFIRPVFISQGTPSFEVESRYDYDLSEVLGNPQAGVGPTGSLWDISKWDQSLWSGTLSTTAPVRGAVGIGRALAVGLNGNSAVATTLIRIDHIGQTGGYL